MWDSDESYGDGRSGGDEFGVVMQVEVVMIKVVMNVGLWQKLWW